MLPFYLYHIADNEHYPYGWGVVEADSVRDAKTQVLQSFSDAMAEDFRFTKNPHAEFVLSVQPVVGWSRYGVAQCKRSYHYFFQSMENAP
jgi:hypothetical protein